MAPFVGCPVPSDLPEPMPLHVFAKEKPMAWDKRANASGTAK